VKLSGEGCEVHRRFFINGFEFRLTGSEQLNLNFSLYENIDFFEQ
jgi:hypothetical protein